MPPAPAALPTTVTEIAERAFQTYGSAPLFSHRPSRARTRTLTYAGVADLVHRMAANLAATLPVGSRLGVQGSPSPELASLYLAAAQARVTLIPFDLRMSAEAIGRIIEVSGPDAVLLAPGATIDALSVPALGPLRSIILGNLDVEPTTLGLAALAECGDPQPSDLVEVVFTSGTTGSPKGVLVTNGNLVASVERMRHVVPDAPHRMISILPLSHIMEQVGGLFYMLTVGGHVEYLGSLRPDVFATAMAEGKVSVLICVPQLIQMLAERIRREAAKTPGGRWKLERALQLADLLPRRLRRRLFARIHRSFGGELLYVVSAAAYLPPDLQRFYERLGLVVVQGYGATECGLATTTFPGRAPAGTVGYAVVPTKVRIAPDGEIQVAGPGVSAGYDRNLAATAAAFTADGYYRTGDAGRLAADGCLTLIGRTRTMFVLPNGMNVFPEDLEAALAVEGFADPVTFESAPGRIEVMVIAGRALRSGDHDPVIEKVALTDALKRVNKRLGEHQRISAVRFYPDADFPRTHTLKVQRAKAVERLLAG